MKPLPVKILVSMFIMSLLFLNKEWLVIYGWGITALMYFTFFLDLQNVRTFSFRSNVHGYRIFLLAMLALLSTLWSPDAEATLQHAFVLFILVANSFVLYYFLVRYQLHGMITTIVLVYAFINYSLALGLPVFKFLENHDDEMMRFIGTELNPNYLSIMLMFSIFLSLLAFHRHQLKTRAAQGLHLLNILLALYTIFLTASRKGIGFSLLLICFYGLIHIKSLLGSFKTIAVGVIAIFAISFFMKGDFINENIAPAMDRIGRLFLTIGGRDNEGSTEDRVRFIREGWEQFTASPIIGYGAASFRYYYHFYAHNNYIELLFGVGFLGPIIYYSIHLSILNKLRKYSTGLFLAAFLIVLMLMDVGLVAYYDKRIMLMLLLIIITADREIQEKQLADSLRRFPLSLN
ncbi:MAG: O-antigen ligase family protein [Chitinophaga sp.]|uniref:O-antigen ligase family protein n=1 Tax=Chitinophaga sp. TaxID=1869181 RepID=UPI0025B876D0|nr:O-antigen ligase family protein [Chitinophaga sp.]MBV8252188.1 O-antigen ligase family protein [Chitinophaga sp.]